MLGPILDNNSSDLPLTDQPHCMSSPGGVRRWEWGRVWQWEVGVEGCLEGEIGD